MFQVSGIEEAIKKFGGLQGVIEAVADEAGGSTTKIARFFTNIRARNAFISLTAQSENFTNAINEIGEASENAETFLGSLLEKFDEQDAVKFEKAVAKLKNTFLEFAQDALPAITSGLGLLSTALENIGKVAALAAAGGIAIYSARLIKLSLITTQLGLASGIAAVGIFGLAFAAGAGIAALLDFVGNKAAVAGFAEAFEKLEKVKLENIKQIGLDATEASKALKKSTQEGLKNLTSLEAAAKRSLAPLRSANEAFVSSIGSTLGDLVKSREKFVQALESQINGLESRVTRRTDEAAGIREEIADNEFDRRQRNLSDLQKAFSQQGRAERALSRVQGDKGSLKGLAERAKSLERVKDLTEQSVAAASASGNRTALFNAERLLSKVLNEQLSIKVEANRLDKEASDLASAKLAGERKKLDELKAASKDLLASLSAFNEDGSLKTADQRQADQGSAQRALSTITELKFDAGDFDLGDLLGIEGLQQKVNDLSGDIIPKFTGIQEGFDAAIKALGAQGTVEIPIKLIVDEAGALGIDIQVDAGQELAAVRSGLEQTTAEIDRLKSKQAELNGAAQQEVEIRGRIAQRLALIRTNSEAVAQFGTVFGGSISDTLDPLDALLGKINDILDKPITSDSLKAIDALIAKTDEIGDLPGLGGLFTGEANFVKDLIKDVQLLRTAREEGATAGGLAQRIEALEVIRQKILASLDVQNQATNAVSATATAQDTLGSSIEKSAAATSGIKDGYDAASSSLTILIQKQNELNAAAAAQPKMHGGPVHRAFGGPMYRAAGGFVSRGTDTIPAMLSHGETVINARSSRKFASQINAINAGVTPVYRAEGGVVNNSVNIGDINVNGTSDPDTTARRVMSQIRREERRGTASRFKSK